MKFLLLFILILCLIILFKKYRNEKYQIDYIPRKLIGNAKCIKDDIELDNTYFMCKMNEKYSPVNINVIVTKYQNFAPELNSVPETSKLLTPSLIPSPNFSKTDFNLIGTNTNQITGNVTLNDYTKLMKITNYTTPNLFLFDSLPTGSIISASLDDNNFVYLPDSIVNYIKYLNDLNVLQSFIDINKISTLTNIAGQFKLYLQGQLIKIVKPPTNKYRLEREIVIIYDYPNKKNIINIQFNEIITWYDSNNNLQTNNTSTNINTKYDYYIINSYIDNKINFIPQMINKINMFGNYLKSRELITDYILEDLIDKINNIDNNNILYVNFFNFGIEIVKRINNNLVFINYFDTTPANSNIPFSYYKNMCPDPANNYYFKGRCYDNCPNGYESIGLGCILSSKKDKLFNPDSNFCNQVCSASNNDLSSFDSVIQKSCWCKSMSCDKCGEYSIDNCKC
jgi:hypothetical protein